MGEKLRERIEILEQEVKEKFESTGLVTNVRIKGFLNDNKNPLHLEYKVRENTRENELGRRIFRGHLLKILLTNYPIIMGIEKDYHETGLCREIVMINPGVQLNEETEIRIRYSILQDIKKEAENYLERKPKIA
jgi:hypothetical protein